MNAIIAERGQVTIPKPLRDRLGLGPHTVVNFTEDHGRLVLTKVVNADAVSRVRGCLRLKQGTDEILKALRGKS